MNQAPSYGSSRSAAGRSCRKRTRDDRTSLHTGRKGAEYAAAAAQARRAERVGDEVRGVADERRRLERERELLDAPARRPGVQSTRKRVQLIVEHRVPAARELALREERLKARGFPRE